MKVLERRGVDSALERKILIGMIMSTRFLGGVRTMYRPNFMLNEFGRRIAGWCLEYFNQHKQAPKEIINDVFEIEKEDLTSAEARIIEQMLRKMSDQYQTITNFDYVLDKTRKYFKERSTTIFFSEGKKMVDAKRVDKADKLIQQHRQISTEVSNSYDPFSKPVINQFDVDRTENHLFAFPGALGSCIGWLERGWLVAFLAPMKRCKSWMLLYCCYLAVFEGLNVLFVSLEMNKDSILDRLFKMFTGFTSHGKRINVPVFDCYFNQVGECNRRERVGSYSLLDEEGNRPEYKPRSRYKPCTYCRDNSIEDYELETWFETIKTKKMTPAKIRKASRNLDEYAGGSIRAVNYPAFSATLEDIEKEMDDLEYNEDFIPDVLVVDYADILAPGRHISERGNIDLIWKGLKGLSAEKNCLVLTASQANRESMEKTNVKQKNVAEDIRKLAHVDVMIPLNQTELEKESDYMRMGILAHRHRRTVDSNKVRVLQALELGDPVFDSEWEVE